MSQNNTGTKKKRRYIKKTPRRKLVEEAERLLYQILFHQRGERCELCGGTQIKSNQRLGLFHILPKGRYPRLRFHKQNLLIAGWFCCHFPWHASYYIARDRIEPKIKSLRGEQYEIDLRSLDVEQPAITSTYLQTLIKALEIELKGMENKWLTGTEKETK